MTVYDDAGMIDHEKLKILLQTVVSDTVDVKLEAIRLQLKEITVALTGNGFGFEKGLIHKVTEMERSQEVHIAEFHAFRTETRSRWERLKYTSVGAGIGAGIGGGGLVALVMKVIGG